MKVKLEKAYKADGFDWPAGKVVDVSNKFAAKLKAGGFLDKPKPKPAPKSETLKSE
jgi:hypothetical protein